MPSGQAPGASRGTVPAPKPRQPTVHRRRSGDTSRHRDQAERERQQTTNSSQHDRWFLDRHFDLCVQRGTVSVSETHDAATVAVVNE